MSEGGNSVIGWRPHHGLFKGCDGIDDVVSEGGIGDLVKTFLMPHEEHDDQDAMSDTGNHQDDQDEMIVDTPAAKKKPLMKKRPRCNEDVLPRVKVGRFAANTLGSLD